MATSKKSSKATKPSTAKPAKAAPTAEAAKAAKPAHVAPVVQLTNAAQSAALLVAARRKKAAAESSGESAGAAVSVAMMKQLKNNLAQPQHAATSPLAGLNKQPKPTGSAGYNRVGGHHQTSGANVARTGVPRRTGGG